MQSPVTHAVEYGGLGGVPANPDPNNSRSKSIFIYTLAAGQTKSDGVRVVNNSNQIKTIQLYATDSEVASGGSFACRQKADDKKDVGRWVRLDNSEVRLDPATSQVVPFKVQVPSGVSVGEHNGCLVIQEKDGPTEQSDNGVQLSFRSAIRMAVTVPGDIKKEVVFSDLLVKPDSQKYTLTAQLQNRGNVSLDTDVAVVVKNGFGRQVYQNGGVYPLLAQKRSIDLNFEFPRPFWGGWYKITGTADYNNEPKLSLGDQAKKNTRATAPAQNIFIPPQPVAAVIELAVGLLALLIGLLMAYVLRKSRRVSKTWQSYTVKSGDTLASLAKKRGTNLRTVARTNKIKAPYKLTTGQSIKLPSKLNKSGE